MAGDVPYIHFENLANSVSDIPPDSIVSRTLYTDDDVKIIVFGFAPGQELSEHTSALPAALHILRGEADVTVGPDRLDGRPGMWVHMPPRMPHSVVARTELVMLLLMFR